MVFRSKTYSVLVVCESEQFLSRLDSLLPGSDYWPLDKASDLSAARRKALAREYDLCILNSRAPVSDVIRLAEDLSRKTDTVCLVMTDRTQYDDVSSRLVDLGISCIQRQVTAETFAGAVRMMASFAERLSREKTKRGTLEEKMQEIRIINKAKWALIEKTGCSEDEAQKTVERTAMNDRISKREAAEKIIHSCGG